MGLPEIMTQVASIMDGVAAVGTVHPYLRWTADDKGFKSAFVVAGKINACMITRTRTLERWLSNIQFERVYEFKIVLVYGLDDSAGSETYFQQSIIEAACAAFRAKPTLNGVCETTAPEFGSLAGRAGLQVEAVEPRMFAGKLCHYAECALGAQTTETRS